MRAPWIAALALIAALAAPLALAQNVPPTFPYYLHTRAMQVGVNYPASFNPSTPNQTPVLAFVINCTAPGNVTVLLGDNVSQMVIILPSTGTYILPIQAVQVLSAGTTATATYEQLG